jgi:cytochrome c biogenesis protein CcmG/thiol:disulfide interchange protein DsbE
MSGWHTEKQGLSRRALALSAVGVLIGCEEKERVVPIASFPPVPGIKTASGFDLPPVDTNRFVGRVTLLNVWAPWCPICRGEHAMLKQLSSEPLFTLAGLIYRDSAENARAYLSEAGNPFAALSVDTAGFVGRALGVRGVPYTFVIGRDRKIVAQVIGGLDERNIAAVINPAVARALSGPAA